MHPPQPQAFEPAPDFAAEPPFPPAANFASETFAPTPAADTYLSAARRSARAGRALRGRLGVCVFNLRRKSRSLIDPVIVANV
jgi:hypothetical protein